MYSKQILTVLGAASAAYAASCSGSATVQNQGDIDSKISSCQTYKGNVTINPMSGATLDFGSVQSITGLVSMDSDSQVASISFSQVSTLGGLRLTNLTALATLDLSSLQTVGELTLSNLAALSQFNFGNGLSQTGPVTIENVQVSSLGGITMASKIAAIVISNCQYLRDITFQGLKQVGIVDIGPNNVNQDSSINFPSLTTATSLFLRNTTTINTPSLTNVSDTLGLYGNGFSSFGVSNLTWVGALVIEDNSKVTNLSFPNLAYINGSNATLDIENNTMLTSISGFPKLLSVTHGGATFAGNINNITLPSLTNVDGALIVDTTSSTLNCDSINAFMNNQTVKGAVTCQANDATPTGSGGVASGSGSGSGSGSSHNAAAPMELPSFLTTGAFAALLAFLA